VAFAGKRGSFSHAGSPPQKITQNDRFEIGKKN